MSDVEYRVCHPEHIELIAASSPVQTGDKGAFLTPEGRAALAQHFALSAWAAGHCVGAAGVVDIWRGRSEAWAVFGDRARLYLPALIRKIRQVVEQHPARRLEMAVRADNLSGHKLARAVGMDVTAGAYMRCYTPDGADVVMYARIKRCG